MGIPTSGSTVHRIDAVHPPTVAATPASHTREPTTPARLALGALALVIIAALGLACMVAPVLMRGEALMPAPLFPLLRTGIEHMNWMPIAALALLGLLAGSLTRLPTPLIALASVAAYPIAMLCELIADSTSHNLFPFECVMYLMLAGPVLLTALAGRWLRSRVKNEHRIKG